MRRRHVLLSRNSSGPELGLSFLLRWGGAVMIAALEFQGICTLLSVWE